MAAEGVLHSAHDVSDGGLAVTLAECCFASGVPPANVAAGFSPANALLLSADVGFDSLEPVEYALFGERGARAIVSCAPASLARIEAVARQYGVGARAIGHVSRGTFRIQLNGTPVIEAEVSSLYDVWAHSLERALMA
jgi:phosphoribosylformylglycinamidine synthase